MKRIVSGLMLGLLVTSASQAYVESFNFATRSDAGKIWTCGAGIKEGFSGVSPTMPASDTYGNNYNGGDFISFSALDLSAWSSGGSAGGYVYYGVAPGSTSFSSLTNLPILSNTMTVNLGSEKMNSSYSVTVCFEAPTFAADEAGSSAPGWWTDVDLNAQVKAQITASVKGSSANEYATDAGLAVSANWSCVGVYSSNGAAYSGNMGLPSFANQSINSSTTVSSSGVIWNDGSDIIPTKCSVTYTFNETSHAFRPQDQSVNINLFTELNRFD